MNNRKDDIKQKYHSLRLFGYDLKEEFWLVQKNPYLRNTKSLRNFLKNE